MADSSSVDGILEFLRRNKFTRAEASLRSAITKCPNLNGFLQKLTLEKNHLGKSLDAANGGKTAVEHLGTSSPSSGKVSKELIVKEIECRIGRNGSESKSKNACSVGQEQKVSLGFDSIAITKLTMEVTCPACANSV